MIIDNKLNLDQTKKVIEYLTRNKTLNYLRY